MGEMENRPWAADQLWSNSSLKPSEYSVPFLGMIFLRYADPCFVESFHGRIFDRAIGSGGVFAVAEEM
jgi:type I restriction enzyme M protein